MNEIASNSLAEVFSSESESESDWRYKRRKIESKPSSRGSERNTVPSDPEVASNPIGSKSKPVPFHHEFSDAESQI